MKNAPEIYQRLATDVNIKEIECSKLWTHCQDCQESYTQEVLCSARDCPIYYKREQARTDLHETRTKLERLQNLDW